MQKSTGTVWLADVFMKNCVCFNKKKRRHFRLRRMCRIGYGWISTAQISPPWHRNSAEVFSLRNCICPATAGSVFRPSTRTEFANVFSGLEQLRCRRLVEFGEAAIQLLHIFLYPSNTGHFDLTVLSDQEPRRDIGDAVGVRRGVSLGFVEEG